MKVLLIAVSVLASALIFAQDAVTNAPSRRKSRKLTPEEIAKEDEEYFRATGGEIVVAPAGPSIEIVDVRKTPDSAAPDRVVKILGSMYRFPATNFVDKLAENACPITAAETRRKANKALMVILLTDGKTETPSLIVCPEERVAVINCDKVVQFANPDEAKIRLIKEMWRAVGFIAGAGFSTNDMSVMQPVGSPLELDTVEWQVIHPASYQNMAKFLKKYGVKRGRNVTYKNACQEGWAPAPTNEIQKAIWEKVKAEKEAKAEAAKAAPPAPAK